MQGSKLSGGMDDIFLIEAQNSDMHYDSYTCVLIIQFETHLYELLKITK